jgi:hypothetical protein
MIIDSARLSVRPIVVYRRVIQYIKVFPRILVIVTAFMAAAFSGMINQNWRIGFELN